MTSRYPRLSTASVTVAAAAFLALPKVSAASNVDTVRCGDMRQTAAPVLAVKSARTPSVRGHVRVQAGRNGWTVSASLGRIPSYISETFPADGRVVIGFCLDVPRGVDAKIIELQPGGVSVLVRQGKLVLHVTRGRRIYSARRQRDVAGRRTLVRLTVGGSLTSVTLSVAGVRQTASEQLPSSHTQSMWAASPPCPSQRRLRPSPRGRSQTIPT